MIPSKGELLGEREVPVQRDILVILAALFRLVAGIACCVVVFIVKGGDGWWGGGPYGKTIGERIFSQSIYYIFCYGMANSSHFYFGHGRFLIDLGDLDMRPLCPVSTFRGPHSSLVTNISPYAHASACIWTTGAQQKFYSVRLIGSKHLRGSGTWCAFACCYLLQLFRTCYRITQIRHIRLWKNK